MTMSQIVTLELDDQLLHGAKWIADRSRQPVSEVLVNALRCSLPSVGATDAVPRPIQRLSDEELLAETLLEMPTVRDRRLSALLQMQQARELSTGEFHELQGLLTEHQATTLRRSEAVAEASRRGLPLPQPTRFSARS